MAEWALFGEAHAIERRAHRRLVHVCARSEGFAATPREAAAAVQAAAIKLKPMPPKWRAARVLAEALPLFAYRR